MAIQFLKAIPWKHVGLFAAGTLFGTSGIDLLGSKGAKKAYTEVTAVALRCKDEVLKAATSIQENANDILEDAKELNRQRDAEAAAEEAAEEVYEDLSEVEEVEAEVVEEKAAPKKTTKKAPAKKAPAKK